MRLHTAGVVLAAGLGTRFGGSKMLAQIADRPMLQHVLDLTASAGLEPVVVVLGGDADALKAVISWRSEKRVVNPDPARGMSSSLKLALDAVGEADRALVLLGDQPSLQHQQVAPLLATERDRERPIVVPRYGGVPGNPVLLEREAWSLAAALTGDRGMSQLFASRPDLVRYVDVPGTNPDVDTPEELARLGRGGPSRAPNWPGRPSDDASC